MPRIAAALLRTPMGDAEATLAAWAAGTARPDAMPGELGNDLITLGHEALAGLRPDLVVLATTKGDADAAAHELCTGTGHEASLGALAQRLATAFACPAWIVSAACASSPHALGVAARRIVHGGVARVLVVAGDDPGVFVASGFAAVAALSAAGSRPFDRNRDGLALGAMRAAVVLDQEAGGERLAGWGASADACHLTAPARDGRGLATAIRAALGPLQPGWIVAHGTGTRYNDAAEALAWEQVAPQIPITAVKGALGHGLGACGLAEVCLAVAARRVGRVPGIHGLLDSDTTLNLLPPGWHDLPPGPVVFANAGFGGLNGAVVIHHTESARQTHARDPASPRIWFDHLGWSGVCSGTWIEPSLPQTLPRLTARIACGIADPTWGRLDHACRLLVGLVQRLLPLPTGCGLVLVTQRGCAATDRAFEVARRAGSTDPQRFAYTLPSTPVGEASIRCALNGPCLALVGASDEQARTVAHDLVADGCPAVVVARVEADDAPPHTAWAEFIRSG